MTGIYQQIERRQNHVGIIGAAGDEEVVVAGPVVRVNR